MHISVAFSLNFRQPVLKGAFCSANSKSGNLEMNKGTVPFKIFRESKIIPVSPPTPLLPPFFLGGGHFSVRKPLYFYPQKKLFIRLGNKEGFLATTANGIRYTCWRFIKCLVFIWHFPRWETQELFFFFFVQLKLQKETSSVSLWWKEEAGHRDTSEQVRTEVTENTIFN